MWPYIPDLMAKPVPRYTSYPPATAFTPEVGAKDQAAAIAAVPAGAEVSLYVHIPYCQSICWYCGCNTGLAGKAHRLSAYLEALEAEIALVARMLGGRGKVGRIAFGGGSPNAIAPLDFVRLSDRLSTMFSAYDPLVSVEIDPRAFTQDWARTLSAARVSRVSLGVQSFAPEIQQAIGRIQPVEMIEACMDSLRLRGVKHINFDLMYGLPQQTPAMLEDTLEEVIRLRPDRIALFGYAHMPQRFPRQKRIDGRALPDMRARFDLAALGYARLVEAGYRAIGFDHFALPGDPLAVAADKGQVHRNFQGFTEDTAEVVLGLGATAISQFPGLIVQNEKNVGLYRESCVASRLSGAIGLTRDAHDQARARIIEDLLCRGSARLTPCARDAASRLQDYVAQGFVAVSDDEVRLSDAALPYARHIASAFDATLAAA